MPNAQHQTFHGFMTGAPYELAIVEFDDQGRCYDRGQMDAVAKRLEALAPDAEQPGQDVILVVFVHGWQHDARSDDDNLTAFRVLLEAKRSSTRKIDAVPRRRAASSPWRLCRLARPLGLRPGDVVADATFWGRQAAGQRVAVGSVRELFGRLRHYRNRQQKSGGNPLLVIVGHSFGGMIVFSALAQSLIQAASAPVGGVTPEFADLVLLVNPAIEAARYIPIYDLVTSAAFKSPHDETASGLHLRAGGERFAGWDGVPPRQCRARDHEATIGDLEKWCVRHALGFVPSFRTHTLAGPTADKPFVLDPPGPRKQSFLGGRRGERGDRRTRRHLADAVPSVHREPRLPARAGLEGRTGRRRDDPSRRAQAAEPSGDLASFAKSIGPIRMPQP